MNDGRKIARRNIVLILTGIRQYCKRTIISSRPIDVLQPAKHPVGTQTDSREPSLPFVVQEKGRWHSSHCGLTQLDLYA